MALDLDLRTGQYQARLAANLDEVDACQRLRHRAFFGGDGVDEDAFDAKWSHLLITDLAGRVVGTLRFWVTPNGGVVDGYAATFYGLGAVARRAGSVVEMGRLCVDPDIQDPQVLRVAWGALTRIVDAHQASLVVGCASFPGVDPQPYARVFQYLAHNHVAPKALLPTRYAPETVQLRDVTFDGTLQHPLPSLLRSYLAIGGAVGDHAVIDRAMGTLHVLTVLEVARVPPGRAKVLRALV